MSLPPPGPLPRNVARPFADIGGQKHGCVYNGNYIGRIEKKMETTIMGLYRDYIGYILGLYWDNGKENGNYYIKIGYIVGLY